MLPIANQPILEHLLIEAKKTGISEFIFIVGYHDEQVRDYFGNGEKWDVNIEYCTQRRQSGTADALKMVEGLVEGNFLMLNGDIIVSQQDIGQLTDKNDTTLSVIEIADTEGLGVIEAHKGKVIHIYEKAERPPSHMANAGLYLFTADIFDAISKTPKSPRGEYEIPDSIQLMIDKGQPVLYQEISHWLDCTYPWDLLSANESLLAMIEPQNLGEIEKNVVLKDMVSIGKNTVVRSGSYIVCLLYTSPSPRDATLSRMPSSA